MLKNYSTIPMNLSTIRALLLQKEPDVPAALPLHDTEVADQQVWLQTSLGSAASC